MFHRLKSYYIQLSVVLIILLGGCSPKYFAKNSKATLYPITKDLNTDSTITSFYQPYKRAIDSQMNSIIAEAAVEIVRKRPEGPLNNLVTDAMAKVAGENGITYDFIHVNYDGLRNPLPKGKIKTFKVYELMPFENYLVTVKLKGPDVLELFNYIAAREGDPINGASLMIRGSKAADIKIKGKPFDINRSYTILTNDYLANGGDEALVYRKAELRNDSKIKLRDAIITYLKQETAAGRLIEPKIEGRVTSKDL